MADHLPASNIITDQSPYPFWALEKFIRGEAAYILVADRAELATIDGDDGQHAFSLKARDEWVANPTDPGPAVPGEKIAMPGGGFWVRTQYADPSYRSRVDAPGVFAWKVNAATGDDEAIGNQTAPLQTHAEWRRRIGNFGQWQLQGQVTLTYDTIATMPPATDPLPLDDAPFANTPLGGVPIFLTIQGPPIEAKAGHGGLVTAKVDRVRATNTENNVTTTGILDATDVGLRLQITAGPRAGALTFVDSITGANQANTSEWEIADLTPAGFTDTHVFPSAVGADPVQVFLAGTIFVDSARMRGGSQGSLLFKDLDIAPINAGDPVQYYAEGAGIMWVRCRHVGKHAVFSRLKEGEIGAFWGIVYELNCYAQDNVEWREGAPAENIINGGLYHALVSANGGGVTWDADAKCAARLPAVSGVISLAGGVVLVGAGSSFRAAVAAGFNVGSFSFMRAAVLFYGVGATYGQGNAVAGLQVIGRFTYSAAVLAAITVAGPVGIDFVGDGAVLAFFFDVATATYLPAGGFATTWAILAAAQPGGLGGEAHFPKSGAELVPALAAVFP